MGDALALRYTAGAWLDASLLVVALSFASAIPLVAITTYPTYGWVASRKPAGLRSATLVAAPGVVVDAVAMTFGHIYPNVAAIGSARFVAWFLWTYGLILTTGLVPFPFGASRAKGTPR